MRIANTVNDSIVDGPGLRFTVFVQGCPHQCPGCHNPETHDPSRGETVTLEALEAQMGKNPLLAGLTLSGGESLCQPEFAGALLRGAKAMGIGTAMESMGCAKWEAIEGILPYLDHYLMDIKHMDSEKHKRFTGKGNELMLENAKKIAASGQTFLSIRVPVIPTFNDTPEEIRAIARFADALPGVEEIYLLPYHRLGQDKYAGLGRVYELPDILPPETEHMERLKREVENYTKLRCHIGG